ncbi:type VI secretion system Vgr family protein [Silvibacterium dinghuense]|uniref:Type VI secretion system tip protein VgrG n=1 Tax=Silvibacterium dinghuense TaxID=1560006 RepID=A0A4Q1SIM3_9BACT|nr:type VI secretion system tip protein VgrG [Silvibacterium dinghuense]RXS97253.1 type VI secretion system tip protein VgrG [Silvibacterium dinghuense]GGG97492.1 type IV secretion protein Rhs [Silvibacterium dinghuense]
MALPVIQIGDNLIGDATLASVEVIQELNQHWWCTIVCKQTEDKRIPVEDLLGKAVTITTTDQDGVQHTTFSGFVLKVDLDYEIWGSYTAQIAAVTTTYLMDVARNKQYYAAQTLTSVGNTVAGRAGLSFTMDGGSSKALNYVQYGETDFSFLNRIVDDYDCWLRPRDGGIEVFSAFQSGATLQWRGEDGLLDFRLSGVLSPTSVSGSHYDHHAMQSTTLQQVSSPPSFYDGAQHLTSSVQSASSKLPAAFEPQRARAMTLDDFQTQLQSESVRSIGGAVTGSGHSRNQQLKAGDTVQIEGSLDAKGTYGVIRVVHSWTPRGYSNAFVCTPWKNYRNPQPPPARTWSGIVSARVVDHNDPKKMGRVKVQFFWQEDDSTHWARTVSPHAGPDRGFMFMPEVGDEVAVAFEDGDPERPVILGALWNGVQTQPRAELRGGDIADNDVKRIMTKSGNRIQMSDKAGVETLILATPNNNILRMTEKSDSTGRTNITIESKTGDIILHAPEGRVHIESKFYSKDIG